MFIYATQTGIIGEFQFQPHANNNKQRKKMCVAHFGSNDIRLATNYPTNDAIIWNYAKESWQKYNATNTKLKVAGIAVT